MYLIDNGIVAINTYNQRKQKIWLLSWTNRLYWHYGLCTYAWHLDASVGKIWSAYDKWCHGTQHRCAKKIKYGYLIISIAHSDSIAHVHTHGTYIQFCLKYDML